MGGDRRDARRGAGGVPGPRRGLGRDRGSGTVLAVGVLGAVTALAVGTVTASSLLVTRAVAAGAADAAALAGADAAAGFAAAAPCDAAREIAGVLGTRLTSCDVDGTTVAVRVESGRGPLGIPVPARARAGQPTSVEGTPAPG